MVSTYLPPVAREFTRSSTVIGLLIGGEGLMALFLPVIVGTWSDRLDTRLGGRLPFLAGGVPVMAIALVLMGFVNALLGLGLVVAVFFAAYFIAYEPYRALYPDLFPDAVAGRVQATQAIWRGSGTFVALVAGGVLLSVSRVLPFAAAAAIALTATAAFVWLATRRFDVRRGEPRGASIRNAFGDVVRLLREQRPLRALLIANSLWELSLAALKTFVVLYVTVGLHHRLDTASLAIGATAVVILLAAGASGWLGDRYGKRRLMGIALWVYAIGLLVPAFTTNLWLIVPGVPLIAFGGGVVMSLPYAMLMPMMPTGEHGAFTGLYSASRGVGVMLGPILGGAATDALKGTFGGTQGYQAVWLVCSLAIFLSIPLLRRTRRAGGAEA